MARALIALITVLGVLVVPAGASPAGASFTSVTLRPVEAVSMPFWCDWGYDWEERCYRENGDRLPVGGDVDKVWRAALRFSLAAVPARAYIVDASLRVHHDGTCLGPRKTSRPCTSRPYWLALHAIFGSWVGEREVEYGPAWGGALLEDASRPATLTWDVTDLVAEWADGHAPNDGVLLRLGDEHEAFEVSGPKLPSETFANAGLRPALEVVYVLPS